MSELEIFQQSVCGALKSNVIPTVEIGTSTVTAPAGWRETSRTEDKVCLQSEDGIQQATLTVTQFVSSPTFEQFKLICDIRYKGEKKFLTEGFIEPDFPQPFNDGTLFGMVFCGGDKATQRAFSGYLALLRQELITIYIEGSPPTENTMESFKAFVAGLRRA